MKRIISVVVCSSVILSFASFSAFAESKMPVEVKAKSAVLMDATSGKVLVAKNENEKLFPASVTKIMTMLLVAEALESGKIAFSDEVVASKSASSKGGSQIWLKEGESMTVDELYKAMAVYSANDACAALAEYVAGSEESFIVMMNERAKELGMKNTNFENCTGLDDTAENHITTAYDIAIMAGELMTHRFVTDYTTIWMDSLRNGETELVNTNKLVRFYKGCTGLKTGTTAKAGCCICATAVREKTSLIAVVMGSDNSTDRFESAKSLLDYGFSNWETVTPEIDPGLITDVHINMGCERVLTPGIPAAASVLIPKGRQNDIVQDISLPTSVEAPVESNQKLGEVKVKIDGEVIGTYPLTAPRYVERLTFSEIFCRVLAVLTKNC